MNKPQKIFIILLCAITTGCATVHEQSKLPDPPKGFVPVELSDPGKEPAGDYKIKRLEVFAKEDISKLQNGTVFLGDSITDRYPVEKFYPNMLVINRGIGGDTMGGVRHQGVYNRLDSTVYNLHPKRIILMIAFNDIAYSVGTPFETKLIQYDYLVWKIRHDLPNTELWCISVLPAREKFASKNESIQKFNIHAGEAAKKYGAHWLDIYNLFLDEKGELKKELAFDSVHPSEQGYELLTQIYMDKIFPRK